MPVSSSDHWMFISSHGALTAGRRSPENALFPYYSCDKLLDTADSAGSLTIVRINHPNDDREVWQPFSRNLMSEPVVRNVYKNIIGNRIVFEEINERLSLTFRYQWSFGEDFGFVRSCELINLSENEMNVSVLDGLQNVMPHGLTKEFQLQYSNLGDAYKKHELMSDSGLGLFYLSSIPSDRAAPSEGLKATTVWHTGLENGKILLSTKQLTRFVHAGPVENETEDRGCRGSYLVQSEFKLGANESNSWQLIANLEQDHADVAKLNDLIKRTGMAELVQAVDDDVAQCQRQLLEIASSADGVQSGSDTRRTHRHQSNVIFNVMRGGLPRDNYRVRAAEFLDYLNIRNHSVHERFRDSIVSLGETQLLPELIQFLESTGDSDLMRLGREYLPFMFSRRHGDPSRPWNKFSIELINPDGSPKIAYEGNWRDIFQNWEAVAFSWPGYSPTMVRRFVNASTADGYNPYRINQDGVDWETPSEDEFSNIGYWGDHQIIYLLKLLEWSRRSDPQATDRMLAETDCAYAEVPYRIASYQQMQNDAQKTIEFDYELASRIATRVESMGTDGKLIQSIDGGVHHVSLLEKLLIPALAKMTNFVPGGGIWLNTQRPEWNDANNALVGNGMSVVTACYLRRYLVFMSRWFRVLDTNEDTKGFSVSEDVWQLAQNIHQVLNDHQDLIGSQMTGQTRKLILDALSNAGSDYRTKLYQNGVSTKNTNVELESCIELFDSCVLYLDDCIASNRRDDGLYHGYNLLHVNDDALEIQRLDEMLEGQVAVISSGALSIEETCNVLDALRHSALYRADQDSYLLYPDRELSRFMEKNNVAPDQFDRSELLKTMVSLGDRSIVQVDIEGKARFNGDFTNVEDLNQALDLLAENDEYSQLASRERELVAEIFEDTFNHRMFTGRSGTFFGYEGLGSIYWHMVSKLALAVIEQYVAATEPGNETHSEESLTRLAKHYFEIRNSLGLNKSPAHYGAFPTDPYSHTPEKSGAKQPGMTGQVKEDVLCRMAELGARVSDGIVHFQPNLFGADEFHQSASALEIVNLDGEAVQIPVGPDAFAWSWFQVPIVYRKSDANRMDITWADGVVVSREELVLTEEESKHLILRDNEITQIEVFFDPKAWSLGSPTV